MERYDVFISFKNTDKNGRPTRDAAMADSLYRALRQKGIRVFCSRHSLDEAARADFVDAINGALESASILVAVGTSREHLTSGWVNHEINAFLGMRNSRRDKQRSIISYRSKDYPPGNLPVNLVSSQSYSDQDPLVRFIETCLKKASGFRKDAAHTELIYEPGISASAIPEAPPAGLRRGLKTGDVLEGRYKILYLIGEGGVSKVYLALDTKLNRTCAVKHSYSGRIRDFKTVRKMLNIEYGLMQMLDHPAIPKIYDIIDDGDSITIVMDYIEGCSLEDALKRNGTFPEEQAISFARQIALLLEHLHERPEPIIHRDLKPGNLMLKPNGSLSLIDFGTARKYRTGALTDTICLGTLGFAAPEQFGGMGQTDPRTDIYNLGATLYQLVTGKNPAKPPYEILPVRQIDPELSRGLEALIRKCTEKDPNQRFQSARDLLKAIDQIPKSEKLAALASFFKVGSSRPHGSADHPRKQPPCPVQVPAADFPPAQPISPPLPSVPKVQVLPLLIPDSAAGQSRPIPDTEQDIYSAVTTVLSGSAEEAVSAPEPPVPQSPPSGRRKAHVRKVTVHPKAPADPGKDMDAVIAKLLALDPGSRQLVRELIDRLSQ